MSILKYGGNSGVHEHSLVRLLDCIRDIQDVAVINVIASKICSTDQFAPFLMREFKNMVCRNLFKYNDDVLDNMVVAMRSIYNRRYMEESVVIEFELRSVSPLIRDSFARKTSISIKAWSVMCWVVRMTNIDRSDDAKESSEKLQRLIQSGQMEHPAVCYAAYIVGLISRVNEPKTRELSYAIKASILNCPDDFFDQFVKDHWESFIDSVFIITH